MFDVISLVIDSQSIQKMKVAKKKNGEKKKEICPLGVLYLPKHSKVTVKWRKFDGRLFMSDSINFK